MVAAVCTRDPVLSVLHDVSLSLVLAQPPSILKRSRPLDCRTHGWARLILRMVRSLSVLVLVDCVGWTGRGRWWKEGVCRQRRSAPSFVAAAEQRVAAGTELRMTAAPYRLCRTSSNGHDETSRHKTGSSALNSVNNEIMFDFAQLDFSATYGQAVDHADALAATLLSASLSQNKASASLQTLLGPVPASDAWIDTPRRCARSGMAVTSVRSEGRRSVEKASDASRGRRVGR